MALNAKLKAHFEGQIAAGKMSKDYGDRLIATLEDAPADIQNGWLANEDYNRQMNEHKDNVAKWKKWEADSQATLDRTAAEAAANQARVAELEAKIASGDLTMGDQNVVAQQIKDLKASMESKFSTAGFITKEDLQKEIEKAQTGVLNFMGNFQSQQRSIDERNIQAFGKPMSRTEHDELITFASEKAKALGRNVELEEAYELKNGAAIREKEIDSRVQAKLKDELTRLNIPGAGGGPGGGGSEGADRGPLQELLAKAQGKDGLPADGGLQEAKAKAADLLRSISA